MNSDERPSVGLGDAPRARNTEQEAFVCAAIRGLSAPGSFRGKRQEKTPV